MTGRVLLTVALLSTLISFGPALTGNKLPAIPKIESKLNAKENVLPLADCSNWLYLPSHTSLVSIGDLDIPGNQVTVEALYMRTAPYSGVDGHAGDIVSKHFDLNDVNYLLRPSHAEITTSNGFFRTPQICPLELNKVYHIAMVYDGSSLKFYRNGFLMSQVAVSGNMILNDWQTRIGLYSGGVSNFQFIGYINEVRIWNVARTQAEICQNMEISLPSPTTQPGLQAYYTFDNLLNKQGNALWNGTVVGNAVINQPNASCANYIADSCGKTVGVEFGYNIDMCSPLNVQFSSAGGNTMGDWTFGDGNTATGTATPLHTYSAPGDYNVSFTARVGGCPKTLLKQISIRVLPDNVVLTSDTTICDGATKQLRAALALAYCWTPANYLDNPNAQNPTTSTPQNITYYLSALVPGNNLIVNGNFSNGNTGFSSEYTNANPNTTEGQYFVGTNPRNWNPNLFTCGDHTSGTGNMMLVNGSPTLDTRVWQQTVTVVPNTNYSFSTWVQDLGSLNPAQLQFSINGSTIGNLITASLPGCTWTQFYTSWNSGSATSAVISIVNKNTIIAGNDFALDDISFAQAIVKRDSVVITVDKPVVRTSNDTSICRGAPAQLITTGAASYTWTPAIGLSNTGIGNPVANPVTTTQYIVTGTSASGCTAKDTVTISMHPLPSISKTGDTTICRNTPAPLFVTGGVSYSWTPTASLDNPAISNPVARPDTTTTYYIDITDVYTCKHKDSIKVGIQPKPQFTVSADQAICESGNTTLHASGGNTYNWSPASSLNDAASSSPVATPDGTTQYAVHITENLCNYDTTLQVTVTVNPNPVVNAEKSNDITCTTPTAQLTANGASSYLWSPATGLDFADRFNPVASVDTATTFMVVGTNQFGCSSSDTITVNVFADNKPFFLVPNAFSPNNDTYNDCFGIRKWGNVTLIEFSVYNRWGEKIFSTTNPAHCWDGTYKGKRSDAGGYAYVIRARTICGDVKRTGIVMLVR